MLKAYRDSVDEIHIILREEEEGNEADNEDSEDEDQPRSGGTKRVHVRYVDPLIEETDEQDEDDMDLTASIADDIAQFETLEQQYDATFAKRVSCVDHCLELVLKQAVEKDDKTASRHLRKTRAILRKVLPR